MYFIDRLYSLAFKAVLVMFYLFVQTSFKALLVDAFTERINHDYFVQNLYNVDYISDEDNLLTLLKGLYLELADYHINFTVFCSPNNTRRILKQVNWNLTRFKNKTKKTLDQYNINCRLNCIYTLKNITEKV